MNMSGHICDCERSMEGSNPAVLIESLLGWRFASNTDENFKFC